jgi:hypothetical protein
MALVFNKKVEIGPRLRRQSVGKPHYFFPGGRVEEVVRLCSTAPYDALNYADSLTNLCRPIVRWDVQKNQTNMTWLRQALSLAGNYYELQIIIHRPFIARPDPTLSEPAWIACNKAAKNCVVAFGSVKDKLNGRIRFHPYAKPMFVAAIFLLLQFHGRGIDQGSELYKAIMTVREMVEEVGSK